MVVKVSIVLVLLSIFFAPFKAYTDVDDQNDLNNDLALTISEFSNFLGFNAMSSTRNSVCNKKGRSSESTGQVMLNEEEDGDPAISAKPYKQSAKLHLKRRSIRPGNEPKTYIMDSTIKDLVRIQTLHRRGIEKKNMNSMSMFQDVKEQRQQQYKPAVASIASLESSKDDFSGNIMATLESGASLGSGEYFVDMFIGTPPKHVSLILDTGSDLNWIQCVPCYDCFEQNGPYYDPKDSSSYKNISCHDPRCQLVSSPGPLQSCEVENQQTCLYFYDYGDGSNTTGDFASETLTVNLTWPYGERKLKQVLDVMFGCGHWNRGLFHGAAGLLGLGRGPLSFSSQLQPIYGHSFSYCLADIFSNTSVSSKLIFGEDKELLNNPNLNFTSLLDGEESPDDTFYYLQIKSVVVGGEVLDIPEQTWHWSQEGSGGTIIDSGSTLTFFPEQAYDVIKEAFKKKIKLHQVVVDNYIMDTCYNVSGELEVEVPEFGIQFADGAVWNFPIENYFYQYDPGEVLCLAISKNPHSPLTIIGNLLQQNFHIMYDTKSHRLGYSPMRCAEV